MNNLIFLKVSGITYIIIKQLQNYYVAFYKFIKINNKK